MHLKGYAAPETKAAAERARLLIEHAEALGEIPDDPLLLFSVLHSFWTTSFVAFNGDALRELAGQFLKLAEKRKAPIPLMIGHRIMGSVLGSTRAPLRRGERILIARSSFTIPPSIVCWLTVSAKTFGWQPCPIDRGPCGFLAIRTPH